MSWANYHTHTIYCDGLKKPVEYVTEAIKQKMIALGFSAHAPLPFENQWSIRNTFDLDKYCSEISGFKKDFKREIQIYHGLEIDFIPGLTESFPKFKNDLKLDYIIGSVHLVRNKNKEGLWFIDGQVSNFDNGLDEIFENDARKAVEYYYHQSAEMIEKEKPDIIGHMDKIKMNNKGRYFSVTENWYKKLVYELLETIRKNNTFIEINTRGIYKNKYSGLYPDTWIIQFCLENKIPMILNSDAHKPSELTGNFMESSKFLKETGVKELMIRFNNRWQEAGFDERGYLI